MLDPDNPLVFRGLIEQAREREEFSICKLPAIAEGAIRITHAAPLISFDESFQPMQTTTAISAQPARRFLMWLDTALDAIASASA